MVTAGPRLFVPPPPRLIFELPAYASGNQPNATTSLLTAAGTLLSLPVPGFWRLLYNIAYNTTATTTGAHFTVNGTTVFSNMFGNCMYTTQTGDADNSLIFGYDTGLAVASSRVLVGNGANMQVDMIVTTPGNVELRWRAETTGTITITSVMGACVLLA